MSAAVITAVKFVRGVADRRESRTTCGVVIQIADRVNYIAECNISRLQIMLTQIIILGILCKFAEEIERECRCIRDRIGMQNRAVLERAVVDRDADNRP